MFPVLNRWQRGAAPPPQGPHTSDPTGSHSILQSRLKLSSWSPDKLNNVSIYSVELLKEIFSCWKCLLCSPDSHSVFLSAGGKNSIPSLFRALLVKTCDYGSHCFSCTPCWCQQKNLNKETNRSTSSNPSSCSAVSVVHNCAGAVLQSTCVQWNFCTRLEKWIFLTSSSNVIIIFNCWSVGLFH